MGIGNLQPALMKQSRISCSQIPLMPLAIKVPPGASIPLFARYAPLKYLRAGSR
jgi:hypothetical protein